MPSVDLNLERDLRRGLASIAEAWGRSLNAEQSIGRVAVDYVKLRDLVIEPKRRRVEFSESFKCPEGMERGLASFVRASMEGAALLPYKSRNVGRKPTRPDEMLLDWGVQHFHIGTIAEGASSANRQSDLLFAWVTSETVYGIGFWPHRKWLEVEVLGVVHDNWPELLIGRRCAAGAESPLRVDQMRGLRRSRVNYPIEVRPGVHYLSPGAPMSNGDGMRGYMWAMAVVRWIEATEADIRRHLSENPHASVTRLDASFESDGAVTIYAQSGEVFATASLPLIP